jgi:hypothetical protein
VINTKDKTTLTGEAKELEQEIELRKEGLQRCACSIYFLRALASSLPATNLLLYHKDCNLPRNSTISQYLRKGFLMLSMTPTSFFLERHLELLWSAMEKILLKTLCSVTMASSDRLPISGSTMRTTGQVLITFGRAFFNVATAQEALGRSLGSSLIVALQRFLDQIKDYEVEKKKLETRRWE